MNALSRSDAEKWNPGLCCDLSWYGTWGHGFWGWVGAWTRFSQWSFPTLVELSLQFSPGSWPPNLLQVNWVIVPRTFSSIRCWGPASTWEAGAGSEQPQVMVGLWLLAAVLLCLRSTSTHCWFKHSCPHWLSLGSGSSVPCSVGHVCLLVGRSLFQLSHVSQS